ncbi:MAG: DUF4091 domain-containing protein [Candidatus Latescibacterota bacterium]
MRNGIESVFFLILFLCFPPESRGQAEPSLWASTPLAKHELRSLPDGKSPRTLAVSGAKGEAVSAQAVYSPGKSVKAATFRITDLKQRNSGAVIKSSDIRLNWVRYIPIQHNSPDIPADELEIKAPNCFPDPLWEKDTISITYGYQAIINNGLYVASYSNPIWMEIRVPRDAKAGDYTGMLTVTGDGSAVSLPVTLHVWDFALPEKQHVSVINWCRLPLTRFEGKRYEKEHWDNLTRDLTFLVENGQTDITHPGFDLIKKKENGEWDTALFENWTEVALAAGMRQFHLHGLGQGRTISHLAYTSEIQPLNPASRAKLPVIEAVAKRRGWKFVASICDEPFIMNEISYMERVREVKKLAPGIRILEALEAEYLGDMDIYCPKLNHLSMWYPRFKELQDAGTEMWYYICLHPTGRYPNRFVDLSMLKHRVLFWIHYLYDLDGYLHWGGNYYGEKQDPYSELGIRCDILPLGDAVLWYPGENGPVSSLRFKAQHDGLKDYGYLEVLESKVRALKEKVGEKEAFWVQPRQRPLELCRQVIRDAHDYTRNPQVLLDTRAQIADEIECLSDDFYFYVQTSPSDRAVFPHGPRNLGIRGLVPPGVKVTVNGVPVENIRPSGYFLLYRFLLDGEPDVIIQAEYKGKTRTIRRSFELTD